MARRERLWIVNYLKCFDGRQSLLVPLAFNVVDNPALRGFPHFLINPLDVNIWIVNKQCTYKRSVQLPPFSHSFFLTVKKKMNEFQNH